MNKKLAMIIKCHEETYWYHDKIGKIFEVIGNYHYDLYQVIDDKTKPPYLYVEQDDVIIISNKWLRKRKLERL
jgi:hypothetical protein